ncbi:iron donor protein CyaY [Myxococcota bacterium]|nr:iron donor protein CyaY [Myxococcota bacterium]
MSMNEPQFRALVADALSNIYEQLDGIDTDDLDPVLSDGVLTCVFESGGTFVLSQQVPARELWLSANFRAWHFRWDAQGEAWVERDTGEPMAPLLSRLFSDKLKRAVALKA